MLWTQYLHSLWNTFWFWVRRNLRFRRGGYSESTSVPPQFSEAAAQTNEKYNFTSIGQRLAPQHWHRNLATLWYMEQMFESVQFPPLITILEPGCQNFSRLPALREFFRLRGVVATIVGIELDAFVPLRGFHSLWDHAQYYISLHKDESRFEAQDFFKWDEPSEVIVCFYPFVSTEPALAWGLPAQVAGAQKWVEAFSKNLKPGGYVLVVHQGDWEEKDFDEARENSPLELRHRQVLTCPFFSTKHPAHGSLYQKRVH